MGDILMIKKELEVYLNQIVKTFVEELIENLVGVYLHGSLAMGCFNPEKSDVDLLVIVKKELPIITQKTIIKKLLRITQGQQNPLEMSIILETYLSNFIYPTPFELHFFHPKYLTDDNYICGGKGFVDPDLAGHIKVTYHRGITLFGKEIKDVFYPINKKFYIESIFNDIKNAIEEINENPIYYTLNLCRVMYYLKEGTVSSKREGGEWAKEQLPDRFRKIVEQSLNGYNTSTLNIDICNKELYQFASWMLEENKKLKQSFSSR
jgi:predicted nucleotidyltransferase